MIKKVKQLSVESHVQLNNASTTLFTSTCDNVDLAKIQQLILEVNETLDNHKQIVSQEIRNLNEDFQMHFSDKITTK